MDIGVEISLYPLQEEYAPDIHEFIGAAEARAGCASSLTA